MNSHFYLSRARVILPVLVASVALTLSLLLINPFFSQYGDDARFAIVGKAVATGQGFTVISTQGNPPDRLAPYGYPLLLALQMLVIGTDRELASMVTWLKLTNSALFAGSVLLAYHLSGRRQASPHVPVGSIFLLAALSSLILALTPLAQRLSSFVMSEIPFLFFSLAAIALLERAVRGRRLLANDLLAGTALAFAFYIRTIGAALIAAAIVYVLFKCGFRRAALLAGLVAVLLVPWLYQQVATGPGARQMDNSYLAQYSERILPQVQEASGAGPIPWSMLYLRTAVFLKGYVMWEIPNLLFSHLSDLSHQRSVLIERIVRVYIFLAIAIGFVQRARAGPGVAELYTILSLAALSLWWQIDRFLIPLLPFLALYFVIGGHSLARAINWRLGLSTSVLTGLFILPVLVSSLLANYSAIQINLAKLTATCDQTGPTPPPGRTEISIPTSVAWLDAVAGRCGASFPGEFFAGTSPDWSNYFRTAEWLRMNSTPDSIVMSLKPELTHVYSARRTVGSPRTGSVEDVMRFVDLGRVDYVVEDDFAWNRSTSRVISPAIRANQHRFVVEYSTLEPVTRVWRYVRSPE